MDDPRMKTWGSTRGIQWWHLLTALFVVTIVCLTACTTKTQIGACKVNFLEHAPEMIELLADRGLVIEDGAGDRWEKWVLDRYGNRYRVCLNRNPDTGMVQLVRIELCDWQDTGNTFETAGEETDIDRPLLLKTEKMPPGWIEFQHIGFEDAP